MGLHLPPIGEENLRVKVEKKLTPFMALGALKVKGITFDIRALMSKDSVIIIPMMITENEKQIGYFGEKRWLISEREIFGFPAGKIEDGQSPADAAKAEVKQETGYEVESLIPVGSFFPAPHVLTEEVFIYTAEVSNQGERALEEGENISAIHWIDSEVLKEELRSSTKTGKPQIGGLPVEGVPLTTVQWAILNYFI